jgi:hypothetical protein
MSTARKASHDIIDILPCPLLFFNTNSDSVLNRTVRPCQAEAQLLKNKKQFISLLRSSNGSLKAAICWARSKNMPGVPSVGDIGGAQRYVRPPPPPLLLLLLLLLLPLRRRVTSCVVICAGAKHRARPRPRDEWMKSRDTQQKAAVAGGKWAADRTASASCGLSDRQMAQ